MITHSKKNQFRQSINQLFDLIKEEKSVEIEDDSNSDEDEDNPLKKDFVESVQGVLKKKMIKDDFNSQYKILDSKPFQMKIPEKKSQIPRIKPSIVRFRLHSEKTMPNI